MRNDAAEPWDAEAVTVEEEIREAATGRAQALASGDAHQLTATLHPLFVWTNHKGEVLDRDMYVRNNTSGVLIWRSQRLEEVNVRVAGSTAILTAMVVDKVERDGRSQRFRMPVTQVWLKESEWVCLGGHAGPRLD